MNCRKNFFAVAKASVFGPSNDPESARILRTRNTKTEENDRASLDEIREAVWTRLLDDVTTSSSLIDGLPQATRRAA